MFCWVEYCQCQNWSLSSRVHPEKYTLSLFVNDAQWFIVVIVWYQFYFLILSLPNSTVSFFFPFSVVHGARVFLLDHIIFSSTTFLCRKRQLLKSSWFVQLIFNFWFLVPLMTYIPSTFNIFYNQWTFPFPVHSAKPTESSHWQKKFNCSLPFHRKAFIHVRKALLKKPTWNLKSVIRRATEWNFSTNTLDTLSGSEQKRCKKFFNLAKFVYEFVECIKLWQLATHSLLLLKEDVMISFV